MRKTFTTYKYFDDLTDEEVEADDLTEVKFGYEGQHYKISLTKANLKKLDEALAPFIDKAQKDWAPPKQKVQPKNANFARTDLAAVRKWARDNGITVSDKGRVPASILDKYDAAHS